MLLWHIVTFDTALRYPGPLLRTVWMCDGDNIPYLVIHVTFLHPWDMLSHPYITPILPYPYNCTSKLLYPFHTLPTPHSLPAWHDTSQRRPPTCAGRFRALRETRRELGGVPRAYTVRARCTDRLTNWNKRRARALGLRLRRLGFLFSGFACCGRQFWMGSWGWCVGVDGVRGCIFEAGICRGQGVCGCTTYVWRDGWSGR